MTTNDAKDGRLRPLTKKLQFRLRTLLLFTTIVCIWCAYEANGIHRRAAAVAMIERLGGEVDYDFRHRFDDAHPYDAAAEPPGPKWLRRILGAYYAANVVEVRIHAGYGTKGRMAPEEFTDAEAEPLAALTEVQWLVLQDTKITDRGLRCFRGLKKLGRLDLEGTAVTAAGAEELRQYLPNVKIYIDEGAARPVRSGSRTAS